MSEEASLSVWIDETKKIISFKEIPETSKVSFSSGDMGLKEISVLAAKGYKLG